jgi:protein SCO1/2
MSGRRAWLLAVAGLAACGKAPEPEEVKRYPLRGVVLSLQPADRITVVRHETIPGFMESMAMEFPVKNPEEFARLRVGQQIRATLCQTRSGLEFWLEGIVVEK